MRDHKRRSSKNTKARRKSTPGWVWLLGGLTLGLLAALAVYVYNSPKPEKRPQAAAPIPPAKPAAPEAKKSPPAKESSPAKQRFDFYTILPEMEVVVPESEVRGNGRKSGASEKPNTYLLQAGSFRTYEEADSLRATLALLGVESRIETVTGNNKETWHRVRVGPYQDLRQANKIRTRMLNNNVNAVLLKVKD